MFEADHTKKRMEIFYREEMNNYLSNIRLANNADQALKTVGHALLWACALMEFHEKNAPDDYKQFCERDGAKGVIAGVRYARNRVLHQFIQLLHVTEGAAFPWIFPVPFFEIRWLAFSELPPADLGHEHRGKAEAYKLHLENVPVRSTLIALEAFFSRFNAV